MELPGARAGLGPRLFAQKGAPDLFRLRSRHISCQKLACISQILIRTTRATGAALMEE